MISYPNIDPVALQVGPLAIRWYGLAYLAGFFTGYRVLLRIIKGGRLDLDRNQAGDLLTWLVVGMILGGRLGYVLFYDPLYFAAHPLKIPAVWEGGMSFHGGLVGVTVAGWAFARRRGLPLLSLGDALALAVPPGLFFGRLANFVNGELYGRPTSVPWAMVFPGAGPAPRHPSQLYEAGLEGLVLWALVAWAWKVSKDRAGVPTGVFLLGYGLVRILVEFVRQPDAQLGAVLGPFTMGQLLSAVMVGLGAFLFIRTRTTR